MAVSATDQAIAERALAEAAEVPVRRPDPVRWLWYAVGGRLPRRYRTWVLRDLTCRTWALRHFLRGLVQVAPVVAVLLAVVPGSWAIRIAAVAAGAALGLLYSGAYIHESVEHRVRQAGFPIGMAQYLREQANAGQRQAEEERYARTWRRAE